MKRRLAFALVGLAIASGHLQQNAETFQPCSIGYPFS